MLESRSITNTVPSTVIFDLDGTLTCRDTFLPYLVSFARRNRRWTRMVAIPVVVASYATGAIQDFQAKEALLVRFLAGVSLQSIREHTQWFCDSWLDRHLHPVGLRLLRAHQREQDRIILISASPDIYVRAIAAHLGISEVLSTSVEFKGTTCTGRLAGPNCKGEQKLRALQGYLRLEQAPVSSYAYGDSRHDLPVLQWVDRGYLVRRGRMEPVFKTESTFSQVSALSNSSGVLR